jgi:hypothetical protein
MPAISLWSQFTVPSFSWWQPILHLCGRICGCTTRLSSWMYYQ